MLGRASGFIAGLEPAGNSLQQEASDWTTTDALVWGGVSAKRDISAAGGAHMLCKCQGGRGQSNLHPGLLHLASAFRAHDTTLLHALWQSGDHGHMLLVTAYHLMRCPEVLWVSCRAKSHPHTFRKGCVELFLEGKPYQPSYHWVCSKAQGRWRAGPSLRVIIAEPTMELLPLKKSYSSRELHCMPKQQSIYALNKLKLSSFHKPK